MQLLCCSHSCSSSTSGSKSSNSSSTLYFTNGHPTSTAVANTANISTITTVSSMNLEVHELMTTQSWQTHACLFGRRCFSLCMLQAAQGHRPASCSRTSPTSQPRPSLVTPPTSTSSAWRNPSAGSHEVLREHNLRQCFCCNVLNSCP